jgi:hypothetical protein
VSKYKGISKRRHEPVYQVHNYCRRHQRRFHVGYRGEGFTFWLAPRQTMQLLRTEPPHGVCVQVWDKTIESMTWVKCNEALEKY